MAHLESVRARLFVVVAVLLTLSTLPLFAGAAPKKARATPTPPPRAGSSKDTLSPAVRSIVATKMDRHAQDMSELLWAVVFLENEEAANLGEKIASEPRIARPIAGDMDDANRDVPEQFFKLQDQLLERAKALAAAARRGEDGAIAKTFGALNETCVSCHAAYLD